MAKYKWDLCELRNNIRIIETLFEKEKDPYTRQLMIDIISQYHNMISATIPYTNDNNDNNIEDTQDIAEFLEEILEDATVYDEKLINLLIKTYPIIKDFKQSDNTQYIVCRNNDCLLEETNEFLKQVLNKNQYQRFKQEITNNPNCIHIQYYPNTNNGVTFVDPILKKKYILLNRCNEPIDISSMVHECFHFAFNDFTSYKIFENTLGYSVEIEGSFADLLVIEDLKTNNSEIAQQLSEDFLLYYQIRIICLLILKCYDIASRRKYNLRINKFNKILNKYGFNEKLDINGIKDYFGREDLKDTLSYALSYLASIDLMEIYNRDPEFAFYLLENIRFMRSDDDVLSVLRRNHITFMDDDFENLKKHVKKIERQN